MKNYVVLYNPLANNGRAEEAARKLESILTDGEIRFVDLAALGSFYDFFVSCDDDCIVIITGGDGTLNETINGVIGMPRRVPVDYLPAGTTNDLAASLNLPVKLQEAADIIKAGHTNDYDIGLFNNRYFTYIATFGAFTQNSYTTPQKLKNRFGHAAYVFSAAKEIKDIHGIHMKVEYDGGVIEGEFCFGSISNSSSVAGMFNLREDDVRLNDGIFEVFLVRKMNLVKLAKTVLEVMNQKYDPKKVLYTQTSKIRLTSPDEAVSWTLDGEFGGTHREVMIHILERAVRICTPENPLFIKHPHQASEIVDKD